MRTAFFAAWVSLAFMAPAREAAPPQPELSARGAEVASSDALWSEIERLVWSHEQADRDAQRTARGGGEPETRPLAEAQLHRLRELALEYFENYPSDFRTPFVRRALLKWSGENPVAPFSSALRSLDARKRRIAEGHLDPVGRTDALLVTASQALTDETLTHRMEQAFDALRATIADAGVGPAEERALYARLANSDNPRLRERVAGRERFLALREVPLDLKAPLLSGSAAIDLADLRGKVVLLDFWHVNCTSCIAAMPRMQTLYEKYRHRGLEIVGVCLVNRDEPAVQEAERLRAIRIAHEQGITWPETVITGRQAVAALMNRYSMTGPQMWLLDQSGRLVLELNLYADFHGPRAGQSRLEIEIEKLLGRAQ